MAKPTNATPIDPANAEQLGAFLYERFKEHTIAGGDGREPRSWDDLRPLQRKVWLGVARDMFDTFKPEAP